MFYRTFRINNGDAVRSWRRGLREINCRIKKIIITPGQRVGGNVYASRYVCAEENIKKKKKKQTGKKKRNKAVNASVVRRARRFYSSSAGFLLIS